MEDAGSEYGYERGGKQWDGIMPLNKKTGSGRASRLTACNAILSARYKTNRLGLSRIWRIGVEHGTGGNGTLADGEQIGQRSLSSRERLHVKALDGFEWKTWSQDHWLTAELDATPSAQQGNR